jgi:hypothetical protein
VYLGGLLVRALQLQATPACRYRPQVHVTSALKQYSVCSKAVAGGGTTHQQYRALLVPASGQPRDVMDAAVHKWLLVTTSLVYASIFACKRPVSHRCYVLVVMVTQELRGAVMPRPTNPPSEPDISAMGSSGAARCDAGAGKYSMGRCWQVMEAQGAGRY